MRVKPVPAPLEDLETIETAHEAIPLVAKPEDDCCARLQSALGVASRDEARRWLVFLTGLELVSESESGYHRVRTAIDLPKLQEAFLSGVYGGREIMEVLDSETSVPLETVIEHYETRRPTWERLQSGSEGDWTGKVQRLLDWLVLLELATRDRDGYSACDLPDN